MPPKILQKYSFSLKLCWSLKLHCLQCSCLYVVCFKICSWFSKVVFNCKTGLFHHQASLSKFYHEPISKAAKIKRIFSHKNCWKVTGGEIINCKNEPWRWILRTWCYLAQGLSPHFVFAELFISQQILPCSANNYFFFSTNQEQFCIVRTWLIFALLYA